MVGDEPGATKSSYAALAVGFPGGPATEDEHGRIGREPWPGRTNGPGGYRPEPGQSEAGARRDRALRRARLDREGRAARARVPEHCRQRAATRPDLGDEARGA